MRKARTSDIDTQKGRTTEVVLPIRQSAEPLIRTLAYACACERQSSTAVKMALEVTEAPE